MMVSWVLGLLFFVIVRVIENEEWSRGSDLVIGKLIVEVGRMLVEKVVRGDLKIIGRLNGLLLGLFLGEWEN